MVLGGVKGGWRDERDFRNGRQIIIIIIMMMNKNKKKLSQPETIFPSFIKINLFLLVFYFENKK